MKAVPRRGVNSAAPGRATAPAPAADGGPDLRRPKKTTFRSEAVSTHNFQLSISIFYGKD